MEVFFGDLTKDERFQLIQHWKAMGAPGHIKHKASTRVALIGHFAEKVITSQQWSIEDAKELIKDLDEMRQGE